MISIHSADTFLTVTISGKLKENDFREIAPKIDAAIKSAGNLRLLIDATAFDGWSDIRAASVHFSFVRDHQKNIGRIAIIAGHEWQYWLVGMAGVFVHPEIKIFDKGQVSEAQSWLQN